METNKTAAGQGNLVNKNNSADQNQSDPNKKDKAKFNQDNDDFTSAHDNQDGENNLSTGSELPESEGSKQRTTSSDDIQDTDSRHSSGTNDREQSQITNSDEASDDWTPRNL